MEITGKIIGWLATIALKIWIVMLCWNFVMPYIFNLPEINYLVAACLTILCGNLFRSTISINDFKNNK